MGSTSRFRRKRKRALFRVKHKRVYTLSAGQAITTFLLSVFWSVLIGPQMELYGFPHLIDAFDTISTISYQEFVDDTSSTERVTPLHVAVTAAEVDPFDTLANRVRTLKIRSGHLALLTQDREQRA